VKADHTESNTLYTHIQGSVFSCQPAILTASDTFKQQIIQIYSSSVQLYTETLVFVAVRWTHGQSHPRAVYHCVQVYNATECGHILYSWVLRGAACSVL